MRSLRLVLAWAALVGSGCDRGRASAEPAGPAASGELEGSAASAPEGEGAAVQVQREGRGRPPLPPIEIVAEVDSDLRVVVDVEGWAAAAVAGVVVVLEPDFLHLRGFDASTGQERWRLRAQETARGHHALYVHGDRALLHAGSRLIYVDARSGQRLGEHPAVHGGRDSGCGLVARAGTCAFECACRLQLFECATGAAIAGGYLSSETHLYHDLSSEHETVCWKRPMALGRSGALDLALVEGTGGSFVIVAVDSGSGAERWRREELVPPGLSYVRMGMSEDAQTCFVADPEGALVRAFACATGATLWEAARPPREGQHRRLEGRFVGGDLWLAWESDVTTEVEVRASGSGRIRWGRGLSARELPWPVEGRAHEVVVSRAPPYELVFVRAATGEAVGRASVGERAAVFEDPLGGLVIAGSRIEELSGAGALRRSRPAPIGGINVATTSHFYAGEGASTTALRREDLRAVLRIRGRISGIDSSSLAPSARLFYGHQEAPAPGRILLVDVRR